MNEQLFSLIKQYGVSGPRYTSYPPAPVFSPDFGPAENKLAILENESGKHTTDTSLYVHVPFCDTLCYFCGCTTIITRNMPIIARYLSYLKKEIDLLSRMIDPQRNIVQMHWGGGTPTYLSPEQILELGAHIRKSFRFDPKAEISVEVDPRDLTYEHMKALAATGFNRISLGVQDFNEKVQTAVNRIQSEEISRRAITWSREMGFASANIDLIYGLPLQTAASFSETLKKIIDIAPERIAVYNFAYVPWMKKQHKLIHQEDLPSGETKIEILMSTIETLTAAGYDYIGMDHFARRDDELAVAQRTGKLNRNFQGYSTHAGADLFGIGMSSISHFGTTYAQNAKTIPDYERSLDEGILPTRVGYKMSFDDEIRKYVIMRLMCDLTLSKRDTEEKFNIRFTDYFAHSMERLEPLIGDGLVIDDASAIRVTELGRLFLRNIAMCFDASMLRSEKPRTIYSQTV
ncbi:MAG TPA: oxygen-independent coproporphyrinogen III oxidase [Bacteroidota bacterium]|nr:oxygen-independent coproporphyrinogen III oxidase [Bacteroidota bacterium]